MNWDIPREYETGLDRGVLYTRSGNAVTWNGLSAVVEAPKDTDISARYVDGVKVSAGNRSGQFSGTIEAYTFPEEFYEHALIYRPVPFSMSYRVRTAEAYKIHIVYNVLIEPIVSVRDQEEVSIFRCDFTTQPVEVPAAKRSSHLVIDTGVAYSWTVSQLQDLLYGTESADGRLLTPAEILEIFEDNSIVRVTDHGDGSFTVSGPDYAVYMLDETTFGIDWPSAVYIDEDTYTVRSL